MKPTKKADKESKVDMKQGRSCTGIYIVAHVYIHVKLFIFLGANTNDGIQYGMEWNGHKTGDRECWKFPLPKPLEEEVRDFIHKNSLLPRPELTHNGVLVKAA